LAKKIKKKFENKKHKILSFIKVDTISNLKVLTTILSPFDFNGIDRYGPILFWE